VLLLPLLLQLRRQCCPAAAGVQDGPVRAANVNQQHGTVVCVRSGQVGVSK
jgi:hypothetical protein